MQKEKTKGPHPIRIIRERYKREGLKALGTAAGFSRMVGCSSSAIRNTESGEIPAMSERLAHLIERGTGVSSEWLMDAVKQWKVGGKIADDQIQAAGGGTWEPQRETSLHLRGGLTDAAEFFYGKFPEALPQFVGVLIEAFLKQNPPTNADSRVIMRQYIDRWILPVVRMFDGMDEQKFRAFSKEMRGLLRKRDTQEGTKLLKIWELMDVSDETTVVFSAEPRLESPRTELASDESVIAANPVKGGRASKTGAVSRRKPKD